MDTGRNISKLEKNMPNFRSKLNRLMLFLALKKSIASKISINPKITIPFKEDWKNLFRGDAVSLNYKMSGNLTEPHLTPCGMNESFVNDYYN